MEALHDVVRAGNARYIGASNVYSQGRSEEILGKCLADCRNEMVLATKVFYPMRKDINARGLSRR